jgi:ureidoglycolate hydrolase
LTWKNNPGFQNIAELNMNENILQIKDYDGEGYQPLVDFNTWRVAYLRFIDELVPESIHRLERHVETDEVFVLLDGQAVLFLGEGEQEIEKIHYQVMEPGKLFNVRRNVWHACVLSRDATILLVENKDTGRDNTDYIELSPSQRHSLVEIAGLNIEEWRRKSDPEI